MIDISYEGREALSRDVAGSWTVAADPFPQGSWRAGRVIALVSLLTRPGVEPFRQTARSVATMSHATTMGV
jgi:hypothetical protein